MERQGSSMECGLLGKLKKHSCPASGLLTTSWTFHERNKHLSQSLSFGGVSVIEIACTQTSAYSLYYQAAQEHEPNCSDSQAHVFHYG